MAPSPITTSTTATLMASVRPYDESQTCTSCPKPPSSDTLRSRPVATTTPIAVSATVEYRRAKVTGGSCRRSRISRINKTRPPAQHAPAITCTHCSACLGPRGEGAVACPPCARMAIATTAAIPAAQGSHRSGRRSATNANTAAITHTTTSAIGVRATCDPRNLPSEACDPCCCERSNAIDPAAAAGPAQAAIRGRAFGAPPKTPSPITATATTSMSPAYNSDFPATPSTVGPDAVGGGAAAVAEPGGAFTPTPNENESVVVWPSSTDTALQLTVYTPSGMSPVIGTTRVLCPCNDGAPVSTGAPELFSRSTSESCASGSSE